jgi:chromosome segregation ATPase
LGNSFNKKGNMQMFERAGSDSNVKTVDPSIYKELTQLEKKIDRITSSIEAIQEENKKILEKLDNISEAMYNPDEGLYARIREQEARVVSLEAFKGTTTKALWLISSTLLGGIVKIILDYIN